MAEFYRCAVGPQLDRIFTRNGRQVGVGIVLFVKSGYSFNSSSINGRGALNMNRSHHLHLAGVFYLSN